MSMAFQPKGLENWINILDEHLLPVLPDSARKVGRLLKSPAASLHDFGDVVANDPIMRVHVARECHRQFGDRVTGTLSNSHHCVSMLGLDKLNILMRQFKACKGDPSSPRDYHYFQAISLSLQAAEQAASWAKFRNQASPDQMFMSSLLYGVPMWCLWRFAHKEMRLIDTLFQKESIPLPEAEYAVLGCTREEIALELANRWHFPDSIRSALSSRSLPSPAFLLRSAGRSHKNPLIKMPNKTPEGLLLNTPALAVNLSNTLVQETHRDWYSRQAQRCFLIVAAYLDQPVGSIITLAKKTAIMASDRWHFPGIEANANGLLWPLQPRHRRRIKKDQLATTIAKLSNPTSTTEKPSAPTQKPRTIGMRSEHLPDDLDRNSILNAPKPQAPSITEKRFPGFVSEEKQKIFERFITTLLQEPKYFTAEYEVIRRTTDILEECTPLERVLVAVLNKQTNALETYYSRGCENHNTLAHIKVPLQPTNLFSQLLKKPAAVWLNPERPNNMAGLVPGVFKQACQNDEYFLMSIFNHKGAYGMFYADRGENPKTGLSQAEYNIFKAICSACSKHLILRSKNRL